MARIQSAFRTASLGLGLFLALVAFGGQAGAVDIVPELSPGSAASALTLLTAGVMMASARFRRK